jgi:UDP-N-acetylglucosamine--N-acetylmuramyl-(pentapeptide) pyrophosphoryl-undecaprenol N-acetylglucosamine transferase
MFASKAAAFTHVFRSTPSFCPGYRYTRTGHPLRRELRQAARTNSRPEGRTVLVVGGSQGSEFLNQVVPRAAQGLQDIRFIHGCGPKHLEATLKRVANLDPQNYAVFPYFNTDAMIDAYLSADVVVGRSGGTLAELALFRLPSILVPLPTSADDHQLHNAREFDDMGAASLLPQPMDTGLYEEYASLLGEHIRGWLGDPERRNSAKLALQNWDIPDSTERIVKIIEQAAQ